MKVSPKLIFPAIRKSLPTVLNVAAIGGVVLTGVLTHKAARKSDPEKPFKTNWKNYIPCVLAGAGTIALIAGANKIHLKAEAALASAVVFYKMLGKNQDDILKDSFF